MDGSTQQFFLSRGPQSLQNHFVLLPYVFFYLGLCLEIKGVSGIEPDPLLLAPGSVLLLLQQHPGEFLCRNKEIKKCFLLKITLANQILAQQTLLLMPVEEQTQQHTEKSFL